MASINRMFRFIPDNVGGPGTKRKRDQTSCERCRKRHQRCPHSDWRAHDSRRSHTSASPPPSRQVQDAPNWRHGSQDGEPVGHAAPSQGTASSTSVQKAGDEVRPRSKDPYLRFVGDLSPEASFLSNHHHSSAARAASRHAEVGVWLGQRPETREESHVRRVNGCIDIQIAHDSAIKRSGLTGLQAISSHLLQECLSVLPPEYEFGIITSLYYAKLDPIFPILRDEVLDSYSPAETAALKQCICIVAALDPKARRHLKLPHTERLLTPIEFRDYVSSAVKQTLDMGFIHDKVVLLQVCALMAFYADKTNCSEVSTYYVSQAVHHSQTLGLHLGWPDGGKGVEKSRRLFWCIWVLDRLNAATNGRPILMHRQDMDTKLLETENEQAPPFRLLIRISQSLDSVISKYRPQSTITEEESTMNSLTFEDLVRETKSAEVGGAILASLEVFYLAVMVLRNRPQESEVRGQPPPSSEFQLFAATSIVSITSGDFKSSITFWPVIPYAVSLAASIAYKSFRNSAVAYRRKLAYSLFNSGCDVLDELGKAFSSAHTVARLATDTMQEVERVAADRSKARQSAKTGNVSSERARDVRGPPTLSSSERGEAQGTPNHDELQHIERGPSYQAPFESAHFQLESPSMFDDFVGDAGIFNDFDPNFDLDRIDQVFSANLDPTQPLPSQDWMAQP